MSSVNFERSPVERAYRLTLNEQYTAVINEQDRVELRYSLLRRMKHSQIANKRPVPRDITEEMKQLEKQLYTLQAKARRIDEQRSERLLMYAKFVNLTQY